MTVLDVDFVRKQFPAFQHEETAQWIYMENGGGSYVPQTVVDRLSAFMIESKVQPYGDGLPSLKAANAIEESTQHMAEMINAGHDEVVIGHCTTMNFYMLAKALHSWLQPGDEVIVTNQEHEANACVWHRLKEVGAKIVEWKMNPENAELEIDQLEALLSKRTRLLCMNHNSNIVGSVNDIKTIAQMVHSKGGLIAVDGVAYAPHHCVDVKALDVDFYALSLYKTFGPHLGLLYAKRDHHDMLANQNFDFLPTQYKEVHTPGGMNYLRLALNPGGVNHEEAGCLSGITDYYDALYHHHFDEPEEDRFRRIKKVFALIEEHESRLSKLFLDCVASNPHINLIGRTVPDTTQRAPTFSFTLSGNISQKELVSTMTKHKIIMQCGNFYAWRCVQGVGLEPEEGVVRVSLAHYNSEEEVGLLCSCLRKLLKQSASR